MIRPSYIPTNPDTKKADRARFWIGTWALGGEGFGPSKEGDSLSILESAFEMGFRHFDTAGFYAHGKSEKLLAKAFLSCRDQIFISSKGGLEWEGRKVTHKAGRSDLYEQLAKSLKRLKTDYLDLFQLHWPDPKVSLQESLEALREFQEKKLIRFWGVANLSAEQLKNAIPDQAFIPHQVHFNPIHRSDEILVSGRTKNRCFNCTYSPLEQGLLVKNVSQWDNLGNKDTRRRNPHFHSKEAREWVSHFLSLIENKPMSAAQAIYAWILSETNVDAVVFGPRKSSHLRDILTAPEWIRGDRKDEVNKWLSGF